MVDSPGLKIGAAFWVLATLIGIWAYGILGMLINILHWWVSFISVLEFTVAVIANPTVFLALFAAPVTTEAAHIMMGLPAMAGWILTLTTLYRSKDESLIGLDGMLVFSFIPHLALYGIWRVLRESEEQREEDRDGNPSVP